MRETKRQMWTPKTGMNLWRFLGLLLLCLLWISGDGGTSGVVLLLFLIIMALARWRFDLPDWSVLIDQGACLLAIFYWPPAVFGLALPLFESILSGQLWLGLPGVIMLFVFAEFSLPLLAVLSHAALSGWAIRGWAAETKKYRQEADCQRRDRYELESLRDELLFANVDAARSAQLAERNRIAQDLHDEVGHELTSAVLALQAFARLWEEGDPQAGEMFVQAQKRLNNSAFYLRETVHNMKPVTGLGIQRLQYVCDQLTACMLDFQVYGNTEVIPVHFWGVLESSLKEALTNVARHAQASKVDVTLDVNPNIVRLSVRDNGKGKGGDGHGIGIRNLRQRARAVGGSISIDGSAGYQLICVLPMDEQ
ncbi:sensor histidine kinase [Dethiobacter alkaliphilus]|uniref:sensor histidine kinase n=1 Tax=Dethiobacter alkaliphilus TaxID=427926 RepID=UPI002226A791|nr:histidine kinase [Dethiobacter alkaliphilus]MCW3490181.1 histidine kinase [Dethiobacter alkaliphilus]